MSVWSKIYERINWKDLPQRLTALAARNLNKMDLAIDTLDDRTIGLNTRLEAVEENPITVDTELKPDSENPVQNKVIYAAFEDLLPEETAQGNPISISDASGLNAKACSVDLLPIQDLHGYDSPWAGGAGKNKLPMTLAGIKSANTSGTWSGNAYTVNGVTFTINTDSDDNVLGITANNTASSTAILILAENFSAFSADVILNGCPSGGSNSTYRVDYNGGTGADMGSGVTITAGTSFTNARIRIASGYSASNVKFYPMIRLSTEQDSSFIPYTNICPISGRTEVNLTVADAETSPTQTETYTETLGQTVYGGKVDFVSGKLTVTRKYVKVKLSEAYSTTQGTVCDRYNFNNVFTSNEVLNSGNGNNDNSISSHIAEYKYNTQDNVHFYFSSNGIVLFVPIGTPTTTEIEFCGTLTTPTEITLTAEQISLLKGNNVVSTDGDNIKLVYSADIKAWVENQLQS